MGKSEQVGPLTIERTGAFVRFRLSVPSEIDTELPADYEKVLAEQVRRVLAASPPERYLLDLQDTPAISSRQLGVMLALQKALRPYLARLPLAGASPAVRRLLEVSRTEQFFELESTSPPTS